MVAILQSPTFTQFIFPFALIFFVLFGILEKTKMFGESNKQLHALIAAIVGLIFVGAIFPKLVVNNLILFLTVAIVVVFIGLLLWGFVSGGDAKISDKVKPVAAAVVVIAVGIAVLWALGTSITFFENIFNFIFRSSWSTDFWTNAAFIIVVIVAIALVVKSPGKK